MEGLKTIFYNEGREYGKIEAVKELIIENVQNVNNSRLSSDAIDILDKINDYNILKNIFNEVFGKGIKEFEEIIIGYK